MKDIENKPGSLSRSWRAYSAVTGFTTSVGLGMFAFALYMKPGASGWWLAGAIAGALGAAGCVYDLVANIREDIKQSQKPPEPKP